MNGTSKNRVMFVTPCDTLTPIIDPVLRTTQLTTTTVTTVTLFGITALLGLAAVLMLIIYLVAKEMLSASSSQRLQMISRRLNIAIVSLILVFAAIIGDKLVEVL